MRARDFIERAERCLDDARRSQYDKYAVSIERACECIELSLKAAILLTGQEYPTERHDVSEDLLRLCEKFPHKFKEEIPRLAFWSRITTTLYKYTKYGYESANAPAKILFDEEDATTWVKHAEKVLFACKEYLGSKNPFPLISCKANR